MRRRRADGIRKAAELTVELRGHVRRSWIELEMQADAQGGAGAGQSGCLLRRGPVHHQTRAREDPLAMRFDDPPVDPVAQAEVVGCDDEQPHEGLIRQRAVAAPGTRVRNPSARRCPTRRRRAAAPWPPRRRNGRSAHTPPCETGGSAPPDREAASPGARRSRDSAAEWPAAPDRKSTRLNSSHTVISYAV